MSSYIPIHIHTDYSIGDAILDVDSYVAWAKKNSVPSIAVTDHGTLSSAIYFNQGCLKAGIKSIIGIEAYCAFKDEFSSEDTETKRERDHLVILAKTYKGYENLMLLSGKSMRETFYYKPIILYEELFEHKEDLIVSTACLGGRGSKLVLEGKYSEAIEFFNLMKVHFGADFYVELMDNNMPEQKLYNKWLIDNYKRLKLKIIWTTDTHYLAKEDAEVHDALQLINKKGTYRDVDYERKIYTARNLCLKTADTILEETAKEYNRAVVEEALQNTLEIDSKIKSYKLTRAPEVIMPHFADNSYEILEKLSYEKLKEKGWDKNPVYVDRVKTELEVIKHKHMEDYFLIVADIVRYSEENGVMVGAGRGSGAGSLVVHLLGITKIDPIKYNLFFERFLNVKRKDPPDIDLDFDSHGRYKVEEYLKIKYGIESVCHVISFGRFGIKGALRDVFRIYHRMDHKEYLDKITKCLADDEDSFEEAMEKIRITEGDQAIKFLAEHEKELDIAKRLVGKNRHYSMHAGGVVIAPGKMEKYIPIMRVKDQIVTGFPEGGDTRLVTDSGLMKFDLLGLSACSVISLAFRNLKGKVKIEDIIEKDNDPFILEKFAAGDTFSVFQFEGTHITSFVKKVHPTKFEDLVAVNALYRPAVIASKGLETYLTSKETFGEEDLKDPFKRILADTYGVVTYQEQTMQVFRDLGGFTLGEADDARHVLKLLFKGRNDFTEFNELMEKFREGCHKTTKYNDEEINQVMETIKKFSQYSFNKSHSCAYAIMGYVMMYLKYYHPAEYYSALLANTDNTESVQDKAKVNLFQRFVIKIQRHPMKTASGDNVPIRVVKPDINKSAAEQFKIMGDNILLCSMSKIKDVGIKAAMEIEEHQPYSSFEDFTKKVKLRIVNKRVIRALIYSEAIKFPDAISSYQKKYEDEIDQRNFLSKQYEYLSFVVPEDFQRIIPKSRTNYTLKEVKKLKPSEISEDGAVVYAFVDSYRKRSGISKAGNPYAMHFLTLYDGTDSIECHWDQRKSKLKDIEPGKIVKCDIGRRENKDRKYGAYATIIYDLEEFLPSKDYEFGVPTVLQEIIDPNDTGEDNDEEEDQEQITVVQPVVQTIVVTPEVKAITPKPEAKVEQKIVAAVKIAPKKKHNGPLVITRHIRLSGRTV